MINYHRKCSKQLIHKLVVMDIDFGFKIVDGEVDVAEFKYLIDFFNNIKIDVEEITTQEEKSEHCKVVIVTYHYFNRSYKTKPLQYKHVSHSESVKNPEKLLSHFNGEVYWLDIDKHYWPRPSGETDIDSLIINDITDDPSFCDFLKKLANNANTGAIQRITKQGRSNQYYRNLENNNHWHDLILMIKSVITNGIIDEKLFAPLVFKWDGNLHTERLRSSLSTSFGSRSLITRLIENVKRNKTPMSNKLINLLKYKKQIILQGPPGTGKTHLAKNLAKVLFEADQDTIFKKPDQISVETIKEIVRQGQTFRSVSDYADYEIIKVNENGFTVKTHQTGKQYPASFANIIKYYAGQFWSKVGSIRYGNDSYEAAIAKYIYEQIDAREQREDISNTSRLRIMQFHPSFTYEDFVRGIESEVNGDKLGYRAKNRQLVLMADEATLHPDQNYILILDEINRANLSAVLGELIYALEYRGEDVESMYHVDGSNKISLPDNLYIIGTMNTADRSVGHIDYAIRRRFAFVDVLPKNLELDLNDGFDTELFNKVSKLFVKDYDPTIDYTKNRELLKNSVYLSAEFRPEDVWLGHSYFIKKKDATMDMRLEYEIRPILLEYIKDGVLHEEARAHVLALPNEIPGK